LVFLANINGPFFNVGDGLFFINVYDMWQFFKWQPLVFGKTWTR
jgi:hypothetical protein